VSLVGVVFSTGLKKQMGNRPKEDCRLVFLYNSRLVWFGSPSGLILFSLQNNLISEQENLIENEQVVVEGGF
jgi:hypothetical protein